MSLHTYDPHGKDDLDPDELKSLGIDPNVNAADIIRHKLDQIYSDEPNAKTEIAEVQHESHRSKHQQFMYDLSTSGKDLASVQTEWHNYYSSLPDTEKHQVWQEFYASQSQVAGQPKAQEVAASPIVLAEHKQQAAKPEGTKRKSSGERSKSKRDLRDPKQIKTAIRDKVNAGGKLQAKHHLQSLLFGLSMGLIVVIIFLFGFFNEVIIAPFIQPSRKAEATPLIVSTDSVAPTSTPEVIIPKINVEIPVNFSEASTDENTIENDLESGVVHYPTTVLPGQNGNTAFFGHSSNNIFNKGKYKFAFVLLHTLVNGDTFYITYNGKVYIYKVISRNIVDPSDVGVLGPVPGQAATATLITCDPPGTSLHRLIVVGQQISPDPTSNTQATATTASSSNTPTALPNEGPTLWGRFIKTALGKAAVGAVIILVLFLVIRWINAPLKSVQRA